MLAIIDWPIAFQRLFSSPLLLQHGSDYIRGLINNRGLRKNFRLEFIRVRRNTISSQGSALCVRCGGCIDLIHVFLKFRRRKSCKVVRYCSPSHQLADWPRNKITCDKYAVLVKALGCYKDFV